MKKFLLSMFFIMLASNVQAEIEFISSDDLYDIINNKNFRKPVVIEFWADWCLPSKMVAPRFESNSYTFADRAYFFKCDVDQNPDVVEYFGLTCLPCILAIYVGTDDNGERTVYWTGAKGEPYLHTSQIKSFINDAIQLHLPPETEN